MRKEKILIWQPDEYTYPDAIDFIPSLMTYIHDENDQTRPCMLVVPGGGYAFVSPTEGEIIAKRFYDFGYNAFVLTYTINLLGQTPLRMQPMQDLSRAIRLIRKNAEVFAIDSSRLAIIGFSAGAHLCGSVAVHHKDVKDENVMYQGFSNRPDAVILSYPVITSGVFAHRGSFEALLGPNASEDMLNYFSLEKQVNADTPPCFLWQTVTDELVPVENSYLFANALKTSGIPYAHHVFSEGRHGLSTADEIFARSEFGEPYTIEQMSKLFAAAKEGRIHVSEQIQQMMAYFESMRPSDNPRVEEVEIWPVLVKSWLNRYL